MDTSTILDQWIDPYTGHAARPFAVLPCLNNIRHGRISSVSDGFGQHWDKVFQARIPSSRKSPEEIIEQWKARFSEYWPEGNLFYRPVGGISNGQIGLLKMSLPGQAYPFLATGVVIENVTPLSFTYTAMAGHPVSGSMTFSVFQEEDDVVLQAHGSLRASDPIYELMIRYFGEKEDQFWCTTLENIAREIGGSSYHLEMHIRLVDHRVVWSKARNLFYNAGIRSILYKLSHPLRLIVYMVLANKRSLQ